MTKIIRPLFCLSFLLFTLAATTDRAAAQAFPLEGAWQSGFAALTFAPNGRFQASLNLIQGLNANYSGLLTWQGKYEGAPQSQWTATIESSQFCATSGGCATCPRGEGDVPNWNGCGIAQEQHLTVGQPLTQSYQQNGPNQFFDQSKNTWQRAGTVAPGVGLKLPGQPCSYPADDFACPDSGYLLRCNGTVWITGSEQC